MPAPNVVCLASWNVDFMARIAQPLARGQTVMSPQLQRLPGGKGSNAAVACARQGAQVCVIARVGDDDLGQMALSLWTQEGMNIGHVVRAKGESSGVALIMVYDDGDNSIAVYPGDIGAPRGLVTDAGARVLDEAGNPIPGLYACGNDMNSVMSGTYPGAGITLGPALTFGYIIGKELGAAQG